MRQVIRLNASILGLVVWFKRALDYDDDELALSLGATTIALMRPTDGLLCTCRAADAIAATTNQSPNWRKLLPAHFVHSVAQLRVAISRLVELSFGPLHYWRRRQLRLLWFGLFLLVLKAKIGAASALLAQLCTTLCVFGVCLKCFFF